MEQLQIMGQQVTEQIMEQLEQLQIMGQVDLEATEQVTGQLEILIHRATRQYIQNRYK